MTDEMRWLDQLAFTTTRVVDMLEGALWFGGDECMKRIKGFYEVTVPIDGDTLCVHIKKMSPLQVAEFENNMTQFGFAFDGLPSKRHHDLDKTALMQWIVTVFNDYISVPPGQLEVEKEGGEVVEITTGAQLLGEYGGRADVFPILLAYVYGEQSLSEAKKNIYRERVSDFVALMERVGTRVAAQALEPPPNEEPSDTPAQGETEPAAV
jgi:hypothetical protein